eukprot:CAMPEP_0197851054 /NCGR_PEP_ID=MMETSP1438-20131217/17150_1 /TAXON_ID=1461541 /ORGANISM="Pterosperma sp., Strain CCMP1384" /LENGTH=351 /DNA_ID=CAMNT_0043464517 /DNA_START=261 /DNA_END=1313 /DNA_ORIENTATION=-
MGARKAGAFPSLQHILGRGQWIPWASRWHAAVAGILLGIVSGVVTVYPVYSNFLKAELKWTQRTVDDVAAAKDIGVSIGGIVSGLVYVQYGGRITCVAGALIGYLGFWLTGHALRGELNSGGICMGIYHILGYAGSSAIDTAAVALVMNFPYHKGMLAGLLKAHISLCSAFFTQLYESAFRNRVIDFVEFCGYFPLIVVSLTLPFNLIYKAPSAPHTSARASLTRVATSRTLWDGLIIYVVLAIVLTIIGMIEDEPNVPSSWSQSPNVRTAHLAVVLIVILSNLFLPLLYKRRYATCMQAVDLNVALAYKVQSEESGEKMSVGAEYGSTEASTGTDKNNNNNNKKGEGAKG